MSFPLRGRLENSKGRFSNRTEEAPFVTPFRRGAADSSGGFVAFYENEFSNNQERKKSRNRFAFLKNHQLGGCLPFVTFENGNTNYVPGHKRLVPIFGAGKKKENL